PHEQTLRISGTQPGYSQGTVAEAEELNLIGAQLKLNRRQDRSDDCDSATAIATATLRPGSELSQLSPVLSTFHLDLSLSLSLSLFRSPLHRTRLRRSRVVNTSLPPPVCTARRIRSKPTPRNTSRSPRRSRLVCLIHIHIHPRTLLVIDIRHWFLLTGPSYHRNHVV
ncbi:hypothetical protein CH063_05041, partial [Colletotrichum higginsianum]